jgi:hypothetical protein
VRNDEYDAFGPWIDEVMTGPELPRLYRDYPIDFGRALLVLKVPRDIARRDADPSMHLYDALLIVEPDLLTILQRTDDTYSVSMVSYGDVFALHDSVLLLDGRFSIFLTDQAPVTLRYNGSARDTIIRLAALLQTLAGSAEGMPETRTGAATDAVTSILSSELDYGLRGDCTDLLAREPESQFVAGHASRLVHPSGGVAAVTHRFRPAHLQAGIMLRTPTALVFTHRRDPIIRGRVNDLSHASTMFFPDRITHVDRQPHDVYEGVELVRVGTAVSTIELTVPTDVPLKDSSFIRRVPVGR